MIGEFVPSTNEQSGAIAKGGIIVERILVKTAIYSFIISFSLLILRPRGRSTTDFNGMTSFEVTPYSEFFFMNLKYSIIATLIMCLLIFLYYKYEIKEDEMTDR